MRVKDFNSSAGPSHGSPPDLLRSNAASSGSSLECSTSSSSSPARGMCTHAPSSGCDLSAPSGRHHGRRPSGRRPGAETRSGGGEHERHEQRARRASWARPALGLVLLLRARLDELGADPNPPDRTRRRCSHPPRWQ